MFGADDHEYDTRGNRSAARDWGNRNGFAMLRRIKNLVGFVNVELA
jgi:hypothetical protein